MDAAQKRRENVRAALWRAQSPGRKVTYNMLLAQNKHRSEFALQRQRQRYPTSVIGFCWKWLTKNLEKPELRCYQKQRIRRPGKFPLLKKC